MIALRHTAQRSRGGSVWACLTCWGLQSCGWWVWAKTHLDVSQEPWLKWLFSKRWGGTPLINHRDIYKDITKQHYLCRHAQYLGMHCFTVQLCHCDRCYSPASQRWRGECWQSRDGGWCPPSKKWESLQAWCQPMAGNSSDYLCSTK